MKRLSLIALLFGIAVTTQAAPLPTAQLSSIVPQNQPANVPLPPSATGTISGTTFAFTTPLNGVPEFFTGPWANGGYWNGPLLFTPDTTDASNPGFTLSGDFHSYGTRQFNDITLGFFSVAAPAGMLIDGISIDIINPTHVPNTFDYQNNASNGSCYAFQNTPSITCSFAPVASMWNSVDLRFWNYGGAAVGYDAVSFHWHEVSAVSPVPEAESYAMLLAGLGLIGFIAGLRKSRNDMMSLA
jgi:hypothetical protein